MKKYSSLKILEKKSFLSNSKTQMNDILSQIQNTNRISTEDDEQITISHFHQKSFDKKQMQQHPDSLNLLLLKAKDLTDKNQLKIKKAKSILKISEKQKGTFLTGTGLFVMESPEEEVKQFQEEKNNVDADMIQFLNKKTDEDELEILRKMINETNLNLQDYKKKVLHTKKEVNSLAFKANEYYNLKLPVREQSREGEILTSKHSHIDMREFLKKKMLHIKQ